MHVDTVHIFHFAGLVERSVEFPLALAFVSKMHVIFIRCIDFFGGFCFFEGDAVVGRMLDVVVARLLVGVFGVLQPQEGFTI